MAEREEDRTEPTPKRGFFSALADLFPAFFPRPARRGAEILARLSPEAVAASEANAPDVPSFWGAYPACMRKYFECGDRASRKEFWSFFALVFPVTWLLFPVYLTFVMSPDLNASNPVVQRVLFWLGVSGLSYTAAATLPLLASAARRFHDCGVTAEWFVWFLLLFPIGWIPFLTILLTPGTKGWNQYGPPPRRRTAEERAAVTLAKGPARTFPFDPFNFYGAADRREYFLSALVFVLVCVLDALCAVGLSKGVPFNFGGSPEANSRLNDLFVEMCELGAITLTLALLPLALAMLTATVRRLHDVGFSGLWVLTLLPPATVVSLPLLLVLLLMPSKRSGNRYTGGA